MNSAHLSKQAEFNLQAFIVTMMLQELKAYARGEAQ